MSDADNLTSPQRAALGQLQAITNGADIPSEIAILSSVNWDVQRAAEAIFDAQIPRPKVEQMQLDDSAQSRPQPASTASLSITRVGLGILSLAMLPLSVVSHLVHFIFRVLRIPLPRLTLSLSSLSLRRTRRAPAPDDPASAADRLVRALEDETGAQVLSRARAALRERAVEPGPSSSAAVEMDTLFGGAGRVLPDFYLGSYENALEAARREARILCAVLLSSEHDDVPPFRRHVLTDSGLVRTLAENNVIVWAGDVRERDAYQASMKLTVTTYPFVAFIALQPRARGSSTSNTTTPSLAILSRHAGLAASSAASLTQHLATVLIPRHLPFLARLQVQETARVHDRMLRAEQDAAYLAAQNLDAQRIMQRRAEEAERARAEEQRRASAEEAARAEKRRVAWRKRAMQRLDGPGEKALAEGGIRVGVRVPDGRRAVRWFRKGDRVADLYAWVDGVLAEGAGEGEGDPASLGEDEEADAEVPEWPFRLAVAFPRSAVPCLAGQRIGEVDALQGGGNLVVEGVARAGDGSESEEEDA